MKTIFLIFNLILFSSVGFGQEVTSEDEPEEPMFNKATVGASLLGVGLILDIFALTAKKKEKGECSEDSKGKTSCDEDKEVPYFKENNSLVLGVGLLSIIGGGYLLTSSYLEEQKNEAEFSASAKKKDNFFIVYSNNRFGLVFQTEL